MHFPLASSTWDEKELKAIQSVINANMFTMGKKVSEYETSFAEFFGSKYAVMVSSGSTANLIMIGALFFTKNPYLKAGDEVIVPAVSWSTTYYPLQQYGLKVKFVDVNKDTLNIDLDELESAITQNTKAILTVNLLGNPNHFAKIKNLIGERKIVLLEDNCESMGAHIENKMAGTFGLMGTFSSFFSHHISTMEGGCVVTDDEELYHVLLCLRAHGWTRNLPKQNFVSGVKDDDPFIESFKFVLPGYNVRPLEMSGAIGLEQLKKLPEFLRHRRENALIFRELFSSHPYLKIQEEVGASSWFGFSFIVQPESGMARKVVLEKLKSSNIECRPIVSGNFLKNPVIKYFNYEIHNKVENAELIDTNGLFVGNHQYNLKEELKYLRNVLS